MRPKRTSGFGIGTMPDDGLRRVLRYDIVWSGEKYDLVDINTSFEGRWGYEGRSRAAIVLGRYKLTSAA